ncbi:MAG: secretin N-terminal domain-containing protein [Halothece sp.]
MLNKFPPPWGMVCSVATLLVISPAVEVAKAQSAEDVQLQRTEQGFELRLQTQGEANISTSQQDNVFIADLNNAQIDLDGQTEITRDNPFPGVESVTITQTDTNRVQVTVTGKNEAPEATLQSVADGEVILGLSVGEQESSQANQQSPQSQQAQIPSLPESESPNETQPEVMFPNPDVEVNGQSAPNGQPREPSSRLEPTRPRATAPPVGDIAVSTIDSSPNQVNLGGDNRVSRLVLREAPVREVLSLLARSADLNLVFADQGGEEAEQTISVDLENESVQQAFNSVLQLSNLQANRRGNTIFVGANLPQGARNLMTRSLRLNQVPASDAANFLASQGATGPGNGDEENGNSGELLQGLSVSVDERLNSVTLVGEPRSIEIATDFLQQLDARQRQVAVNVKIIDVNLLETEDINTSFSFGIADTFFSFDEGQATVGVGEMSPPSADQVRGSELNRPIIPNPNRSQQQFIDPTTGEPTEIPDDPFETGVTGSDRLFLTADGDAVPVQQLEGFGGNQTPLITESAELVPAIEGEEGTPGSSPLFFDANGNPRLPSELQQNGGQFPALTDEEGNLVPARGAVEGTEGVAPRFFDEDGVPRLISELAPFGGEFQPLQDVDSLSDILGSAAELTRTFSEFTRFPNKFLAQLEAQVTSGNAKILTDPTLTVQEGELAEVNLTEEVFGGTELVTREVGDDSVTVEEPVIRDAGLIVDVNVERIDDNGFVTLSVEPTVSSISSSQDTPVGEIALLQERSLSSGQIRLRDGETLILAGIIQDQDRTTVSKVPILGDLPIIGSLFRSTNRDRNRQEVIVLLTPQILEDSLESGGASVNYEPGPGAREMLEQQGYPTPRRRR